MFPIDMCIGAIKHVERCAEHPNIISLIVDTVSYNGGVSDLKPQLDRNVTGKHPAFHLRFCSNKTHDSAFVRNVTAKDGVIPIIRYNWRLPKESGIEKVKTEMLLVQLFPSTTNGTLLGCATSYTKVYSSGNQLQFVGMHGYGMSHIPVV